MGQSRRNHRKEVGDGCSCGRGEGRRGEARAARETGAADQALRSRVSGSRMEVLAEQRREARGAGYVLLLRRKAAVV